MKEAYIRPSSMLSHCGNFLMKLSRRMSQVFCSPSRPIPTLSSSFIVFLILFDSLAVGDGPVRTFPWGFPTWGRVGVLGLMCILPGLGVFRLSPLGDALAGVFLPVPWVGGTFFPVWTRGEPSVGTKEPSFQDWGVSDWFSGCWGEWFVFWEKSLEKDTMVDVYGWSSSVSPRISGDSSWLSKCSFQYSTAQEFRPKKRRNCSIRKVRYWLNSNVLGMFWLVLELT